MPPKKVTKLLPFDPSCIRIDGGLGREQKSQETGEAKVKYKVVLEPAARPQLAAGDDSSGARGDLLKLRD